MVEQRVENKPSEYPEIGDHGVIGDLNTVALVSSGGEINFFCFPRFDSPTLFASLLDCERGGSFVIRRADPSTRRQQVHVPETNVLLTRFLSMSGILEVTDFMPIGKPGEPPRIIRILRVVRGEISVEIDCVPGFDYARDFGGSKEGGFTMCSFWYIECLARAGRLLEARQYFEKMLSYANHLGLYSEELGLDGRQLGNFPQAFTHLALISAAFSLNRELDDRRSN